MLYASILKLPCMRTLFLLLLSCGFTSFSFAQDDPLKALLNEGVALHDKGDYDGAIKKYDEIIKRDKNYGAAYYEKSFSLYTAGRYQECVDVCKELLDKIPDYENVKNVYVNYGSSLDALGKADEAIKVYNKGIKKCPDFYLLPFNRGITEYNQGKLDEAAGDMKKSVSLNPSHASSHMSLAYCVYKKNKIAAVLALATFLLVEPNGKRAENNLKLLLQLLGSNVEKKDDKTINITLAPSTLDDKKGGEDDFHLTELTLSLTGALDLSEEHKKMSPAERLKDKLEILGTMNSGAGGKKGFFTSFYLPFFAAMKEGGFLETASNIMYSSSGDETNKKWLDENQDKVQAFNKWLDEYKWNTE